jgi:hypothetical protein
VTFGDIGQAADFRSAHEAPQMRIVVEKIEDDISICFVFEGSLNQTKRYYVRETVEWPDRFAETLEAAAAEIRRLREVKP